MNGQMRQHRAHAPRCKLQPFGHPAEGADLLELDLMEDTPENRHPKNREVQRMCRSRKKFFQSLRYPPTTQKHKNREFECDAHQRCTREKQSLLDMPADNYGSDDTHQNHNYSDRDQ